ncbi:MAG: hypothetical protein L3J28_07680 [Candidatus Polarisedimenticolaceae bacterium]|nr:hypothetical protein [Candidatus Polarisedimenticolaceae bacterium]
MDRYVYLDQNILSDLRSRKLEAPDKSNYARIKELCLRDDVLVVYSDTHLDEINQITVQAYKDEHIVLLKELGATYIIPISTELSAKCPELVWEDYLGNIQDNERMGVNTVLELQDLINRKFAGLPVEQSFHELNDQLKNALTNMLENSVEQFERLDPEDIKPDGEEIMKQTLAHVQSQINDISEMVAFEVPEDQQLGPAPLKELDRLQELDIENKPPNDVVPLLDELFSVENPDYSWSDYFDNTVHNQIARCYSLMNWAGYYSDDFTRTTNRGDRFRASNNDLMHVRNAAGATFLVSNDGAFIKKAEACYSHLKVPTVVCNGAQLIEYL